MNNSFNNAAKGQTQQQDKLAIADRDVPGENLAERSSDRTLQRKSSPKKWFSNLPIQKKQVWGLILSDVIPIVGLFIVGEVLVRTWGKELITDRAKSEIAVTQDKYQDKVEQTGLSFKLLATNSSIVRGSQQGEALTPDLKNEIRSILQEETKILKIEYATLVGRDLKIIANANRDRQGELFSLNSLVEQVFERQKNIQQIQANAIVPWSELEKESPASLPKGFRNRDALIRYTITPVKDPNNREVIIGALVSGDIVNNKFTIPNSILEDFNGGYSAIYSVTKDGKYQLATALNQSKNRSLKEADRAVDLPSFSLLTSAVKATGKAREKVVIDNINIQGQVYTTAAIALPSEYQQRNNSSENILSDDRPVAILVRGTPKTPLEELRKTYYLLHFPILLVLALFANRIIAKLLRQTIAEPAEKLREVTARFSSGDRSVRSEINSQDEIGQLSATFNQLANNIVKSETNSARAANRAMLLEKLASARDAQELESALNRILSQIRHNLNVDRALVYKFDANWHGKIIAESVVPGFPRSMGSEIVDPCFSNKFAAQYQQGRTKAIDNIYEAGLTECHIKLLEPLSVKASLVVPILTADRLYGLLIAHQCAKPHQWQKSEVEYLSKIGAQTGLSLNAFLLLEEKQEEAKRERQNSSHLQQELFQLVSEVESLSEGDLTVRAQLNDSEISIVADLFNSAIENLQDVVILVKQAAAEVNNSVSNNQNTIRELAERAGEQTHQVDRTLNSVEKMTLAISQVADNAKEAAVVARSASNTANLGGEAMDRTVRSIMQLEDTIATTAKKVKRLGQSSQQIAKAISLINQIALKTKVLAVNAGIEAGRAGEEGQGFAIVAEEVGKLAAQSAAATKEIEQIVENIQIETSELAKTMKVGTTQISEGTRQLEDTKNNLVQLQEVSRQIDKLVDSISSATISQAETSQSVNNLMREIARISQQTSQSSYEVDRSLQQTGEVAKKLQISVRGYKVKN